MDVARKNITRTKWLKRLAILIPLAIAVPLITLGLSRMKPAAPSVQWSTVWPGTVKRGEMLRNVRGLGTLVPEEVLSVPAVTEGRIERKLLLPGAMVGPDTVLVELSNPQLLNAMVDAEWQMKAAEASYTDLKITLQNRKLDQQAALESVRAQLTQSKLEADRDEALYKDGLAVEIKAKISRTIANNFQNRLDIDTQRLKANDDSIAAQLAVQQTTIEKMRATYHLRKSEVEALKVRAGTVGVLREIPVEVGQRVAAGMSLAKIVQPTRLKAELKIAETQAKDVLIGQPAEIDTRNGIIKARVSRIDPAAINGTVTVDCQLLEALPKGARPDLSVEGTVELERLRDVMFVERPVFGQERATVTLFKLEPGGRFANQAKVKFGRTSVAVIEVVEGLRVGDQIILSDMSQWDNHERIELQR